jgi:hypothetical protein
VIATTTSRPITVYCGPLQCLTLQMGIAVVPSAPLRLRPPDMLGGRLGQAAKDRPRRCGFGGSADGLVEGLARLATHVLQPLLESACRPRPSSLMNTLAVIWAMACIAWRLQGSVPALHYATLIPLPVETIAAIGRALSSYDQTTDSRNSLAQLEIMLNCDSFNGGGIKTNLPTCLFLANSRWASTIRSSGNIPARSGRISPFSI